MRDAIRWFKCKLKPPKNRNLEGNNTPARKGQFKTVTDKTGISNNDERNGKVTINKSPSDTTIYAPALNLIPRHLHTDISQMPVLEGSQQSKDNTEMLQNTQPVPSSAKQPEQTQSNSVDNNLIQQIANFVEQVHLENEGQRDNRVVQGNQMNNGARDTVQPGTSGGKGLAAMLDEADQYARNMVLQAERFRADV